MKWACGTKLVSADTGVWQQVGVVGVNGWVAQGGAETRQVRRRRDARVLLAPWTVSTPVLRSRPRRSSRPRSGVGLPCVVCVPQSVEKKCGEKMEGTLFVWRCGVPRNRALPRSPCRVQSPCARAAVAIVSGALRRIYRPLNPFSKNAKILNFFSQYVISIAHHDRCRQKRRHEQNNQLPDDALGV